MDFGGAAGRVTAGGVTGFVIVCIFLCSAAAVFFGGTAGRVTAGGVSGFVFTGTNVCGIVYFCFGFLIAQTIATITPKINSGINMQMPTKIKIENA